MVHRESFRMSNGCSLSRLILFDLETFMEFLKNYVRIKLLYSIVEYIINADRINLAGLALGTKGVGIEGLDNVFTFDLIETRGRDSYVDFDDRTLGADCYVGLSSIVSPNDTQEVEAFMTKMAEIAGLHYPTLRKLCDMYEEEGDRHEYALSQILEVDAACNTVYQELVDLLVRDPDKLFADSLENFIFPWLVKRGVTDLSSAIELAS